MVNFVNKSSGSSTVGVCGCREGAKNDAFRGVRGEVGVRKLDRGDKCGIALERGCSSADEGGEEERGRVDGRRAMRVGPKTRSRQRSKSHQRSHAQHNRTTLSIH
jgi:hypothetical protein